MIGRTQLDRVLGVVRASGVGTEVEALLRPTGDGRPRQLTADVLFAGMILTVLDGRSLELTNVHRTLTREIARSAQAAIGTRRTPHGADQSRPISIRQVRYLVEAIDRRLRHTAAAAPGLEPVEAATRAEALQRILGLIIDSSVPEHLRGADTMSLDASAMDSHARGRRRPVPVTADDEAAPEDSTLDEGVSFDPDARWGYRTKTYDNRTNHVFGYDLFALVAAPTLGSPPNSLPNLIHRLTLRPAGLTVVDPALNMLDDLAADGRKVTELLADRAWSYKTPDTWAEPLRARGIEPVFDLHPHDRGVRDLDGIRMVDGTPHCPAMPDDLVDVVRPATLSAGTLKRSATTAERVAHASRLDEISQFHARIAQRQQWAFRRVSAANAKGDERWECPAQAGKLKCEHCPMSQFLPEDTPQVQDPPAAQTRPKACRQRTVTIPSEAIAKLRQRLYWGSPEWVASFNRRTYVEGFFGTYKSANRIKRGWTRLVGLVKTSLLAACAAAATNIMLLRAWSRRTGDITSPLCEQEPDDLGFEEIPGPGEAPVAHGPPATR